MRRTGARMFGGIVIMLGVVLVFLHGCAGARYLKTQEVDPQGITGTYTLFLHGGRYGSDLENIAILAGEDTPYTFELYSPEFDYKVRKHVPAEEAVRDAGEFVRFHYAFWKPQWSRILDYNGRVIGYELKPLYYPLEFGYSDILDVTYVIRDHTVTCRIQFKPEMEKGILGEEGPLIFRRHR